MPNGATGIVAVSPLLVGLTPHPTRGEVGRADWTKRISPVEALQMYDNFNAVHLHLHPSKDDRLASMPRTISASSGLDHTEITDADATQIQLNMQRVQWR